MRRGLVWLLVMTPTLALGGSSGPLHWSPDSRWVAYTTAIDPGRSSVAPGWIFGPDSNGRNADRRPRDEAPAPPCRYRVQAAAADSGMAVVLLESTWPLTSPAWSADGRTLAVGRAVSSGGAPARFEVVLLNETPRTTVLCSHPIADAASASIDLARLTLAWSPDGRYLAVPDLKTPPGLSVVRADNGRVLKSLPGASSPAWSTDGTRLAFTQVDKVSSLHLMESNFGPSRLLADVGQSDQEPFWSRDGRSVFAVARRVVDRRRGPSQQIELLKIPIDSGAVETADNLGADLAEPEKDPLGVCLTINRDADEMFFSIDLEGQPAVIVWRRMANHETVDRFNPLDFLARIGSIALAPNGKTLAIRFGAPGDGSTVAVWDVESRRLTLVASDDVARLSWIGLLTSTAKTLLQTSLPPAAVAGRSVARPTILPVPGEISPNLGVLSRLNRLGRFGRSLCEGRLEGAGSDEGLDVFLEESKLFFEVLRGDYPSGLRTLEALEARTSAPALRQRLLAVRAQLYLGMREFEQAADPIAYLRTREFRARRIEESPAGVALVAEPDATDGWADYLSARLDDLAASATRADDNPAEPPARRIPGLPFAPPVGVFPQGRLPDALIVAPRIVPNPNPNLVPPAPPGVRAQLPRKRLLTPRKRLIPAHPPLEMPAPVLPQ